MRLFPRIGFRGGRRRRSRVNIVFTFPVSPDVAQQVAAHRRRIIAELGAAR